MPSQEKSSLSKIRVSFVYFMGLVTGTQLALYLFDYYDDGIADIRSLYIGIVLFLFSVGIVVLSFRTDESESEL